jgi:hypothetical protein
MNTYAHPDVLVSTDWVAQNLNTREEAEQRAIDRAREQPGILSPEP